MLEKLSKVQRVFFMRINYYLDNWLQFIKLNVQTWFEYRVNFVIGIVAMALSNLITVVFFWAVFRHIPDLNGWSFGQLLFMFGFWAFSGGIWHAFLAEANPHNIERFIRNGELDRWLLRPGNTLVFITIRRFDDDAFGDILMGAALLAYSSNALGLVWTAQNVLALVALSLGSILVWFSLNVIASTLGFWLVSVRALGDMLWSVSRFIEYPLDIYNRVIVYVLTFVIPLGFVSFYPAQYFFGNMQWMLYAYATLPLGLLMFGLAYKFWSYGLKNYSSTGS